MIPRKNVLLIGASQGIGKAIALEFSHSGYNLCLLSKNADGLCKVTEDITSAGSICHSQVCDISDYYQVKSGIEFALKSLGSIDIAIINSGVGHPEWMSSFSSEGYKEIMSINAFGIAHALEFLIPIMRSQGYGKIAGVTSQADSRGFIGSSAYASSKAAASVMLESARVELKRFGISVITIRPGFVKTAMTDKNEFKMPFLQTTQSAAFVIRRGIEKNKSIVQFPFAIVWLNRLIKIMPNWLFDRLVRMGRKAQ